MKKYTKNKNFIPDRFFYKIEKDNKRYEFIICVLFMLINLYLMPDLSRDISKINNKAPVINDNIKQDKSKINNTIIWIKNISNYNIIEAHITNGVGEVVVDEVSKIKDLNLDKSININDISLNNEKKYKLGVSSNE